METTKKVIKVSDLKTGYYMFGNKGAVWSNEAHLSKSGDGTHLTLCGTPMLSTNWARIEEVKEIGCPLCVEAYEAQVNFKMFTHDEEESTEENWNRGLKLIKEGNVIETSESVYDWFLGCVPPIKMERGAFLNSEPYRHNSDGKGVYYMGFQQKGKFYGCHATVAQFNEKEPLTRM